MKVLVIDDHFLIRDALRRVLEELDQTVSILEASDCGQAMRLIETQPDSRETSCCGPLPTRQF